MDKNGIKVFKAFTLTEAVITMVIIGITAVLVVPPLLQNHQRKVLYAKFTKIYNTLDSLLPIIIKDKGKIYNWSDEDCTDVINYLDVIKECSTDTDCFASSYRTMKQEREGNNYGNGFFPYFNDTSENLARPKRMVMLKDGSAIGAYMHRYDTNLEEGPGQDVYCMIVVDTNGKKKPNVYGKDLWGFQYRVYNALYPYYRHDDFDVNGISTKRDGDARANMPDDRKWKDCQENISSLKFCAEKLLREHAMNY